jgi:hypothetical protein
MSILSGIPPTRYYTQILTSELEEMIAENAKLKEAICQHSDIVLAEWEALKAENVRYRTALEFYADEDNWETIDVGSSGVASCLICDGWPGDIADAALLPPKPEGESDAE